MYSVRVLSRNCSLRYGENLTAEKAAEVIFPNITRSREREGEERDALRENDSALHKKRSAPLLPRVGRRA